MTSLAASDVFITLVGEMHPLIFCFVYMFINRSEIWMDGSTLIHMIMTLKYIPIYL